MFLFGNLGRGLNITMACFSRVITSLMSVLLLFSFSVSFFDSTLYFHQLLYSLVKISTNEHQDRLLSLVSLSSGVTVVLLTIGRFILAFKVSTEKLDNGNEDLENQLTTVPV